MTRAAGKGHSSYVFRTRQSPMGKLELVGSDQGLAAKEHLLALEGHSTKTADLF